jgi:hypothetical protein
MLFHSTVLLIVSFSFAQSKQIITYVYFRCMILLLYLFLGDYIQQRWNLRAIQCDNFD